MCRELNLQPGRYTSQSHDANQQEAGFLRVVRLSAVFRSKKVAYIIWYDLCSWRQPASRSLISRFLHVLLSPIRMAMPRCCLGLTTPVVRLEGKPFWNHPVNPIRSATLHLIASRWLILLHCYPEHGRLLARINGPILWAPTKFPCFQVWEPA